MCLSLRKKCQNNKILKYFWENEDDLPTIEYEDDL